MYCLEMDSLLDILSPTYPDSNEPSFCDSFLAAINVENHSCYQKPCRLASNQEKKEDEKTGEGKLNKSLTNIQWLGEMKAVETNKSIQQDYRMLASDKQLKQISSECGRKKRPPYSYMHLIQMAICSKKDRHLMLREIYKWIEEKFPYYKYHPNQGWKNSIRHNLSLYDIFVRKKVSVPGKTGTSYWTLREDANKQILAEQDSDDENVHRKCDKKPVPLLPKPLSYESYALVPVQGVIPIMIASPLIVSADWAMAHTQRKTGNHKRKKKNDPGEHVKKQIKIAPKSTAFYSQPKDERKKKSEIKKVETTIHVFPKIKKEANKENGIGNIINKIEKDIPGCIDNLLSATKDSTPFKSSLNTPSWLSPIHNVDDNLFSPSWFTPPKTTSDAQYGDLICLTPFRDQSNLLLPQDFIWEGDM